MRIPRWARITIISITVVLVLTIGGGWAVFTFVIPTGPEARCKGHEHFALAGWRDSVQAFGPLAVRGCMVDDLLATRDLHGRSRAEIVALLGEPPKTDYFREYDLVYWLGPERGPMSIDSEWLVFRLDSAQRVREYERVTD